MRRDTIVIPIEGKAERKGYALIPLRGEASFLFPPCSIQEEGIEYEVQRLLSFEEWPDEKTDIEEISCAIERVEAVKQHLDEYLMAEGNVSWHPEHVFWNEFQKELQVLFVPDGSGGRSKDFWRTWSESLLKRMIAQGWKDEARIIWIVRLCQRIESGQEILPVWEPERTWEQPATAVPEAISTVVTKEKQEKRKKRFPSLLR